jgi:hypothetical protein
MENRTSDLLACSIVPHLTTLPHAPFQILENKTFRILDLFPSSGAEEDTSYIW